MQLLRERETFIQEVLEEKQLNSKITSLLLSSFVFFAVYGLIIGSFHSGQQAIASALKLPSLYLLTLIISLPTLYIFNALFGAKKSLRQHFTLVLAAASVIAILLCGFAPITFFFLTTVTVADYHFFLLLNVCIFGLTGLLGVSFLYRVMRPVEDEDTSQNVKVRTTILRFWLCLYGFVGSQLGWTLRPFFGSPGEFQLFRPREGNFLVGVWHALVHMLGLAS